MGISDRDEDVTKFQYVVCVCVIHAQNLFPEAKRFHRNIRSHLLIYHIHRCYRTRSTPLLVDGDILQPRARILELALLLKETGDAVCCSRLCIHFVYLYRLTVYSLRPKISVTFVTLLRKNLALYQNVMRFALLLIH